MATVTMTGKEYEELLKVKDRYEELMFLLVGARFPEVKNDPEYNGCHVQETKNLGDIYPKWLVSTINTSVTNFVKGLDAVAFKNLVREGLQYYDPIWGEFISYERNAASINLLSSVGVSRRWEEVQKEREANE